tara:strand:- start:398 stop:649 length:252 start_codon:yes stop_codon:yes gene_type:complete
MASVIESLVFFAVANFKGRRYIRITSIFAMGAVEISPHTDARRNSLLGKIGNKYTTKSALYNKYIRLESYAVQAEVRSCTFNY